MTEASTKMFVGMKVPTYRAKSLCKFRDANFRNLAGIKWSQPSDLHITLRFLGSQSLRSAGSIVKELADIASPPINITLDGGDMFDDVGVLIVRVVPDTDLMKLQASVDRVAMRNGVLLAQHPYHPHISIGRISEALLKEVSPRETFGQAASQLSQFAKRFSPSPFFTSSGMSLFTSVEGRYTVMQDLRFAEHSADEQQ